MYEAYRCLQNNGEKVYVVNDTYPEKLNANTNLELLIVPCCNYLPESVWQEIEEFIGRGKTVIFAEYNTSYYNENGKSLDQDLKNNVLNDSVRASFGGWNANNITLSGCENVCNAIESEIAEYKREIIIETSNKETEWTVAEYDGGYVVNLCNYGNETTTVAVKGIEGKYDGIFDLTNNDAVSETFTLAPYETKLLKVVCAEEMGMNFYYSDGTVATEIKADTILSKVNTVIGERNSFVHILAVYSGDVLKSVMTNDGTSDESGKAISQIGVTIKEGEVSGTALKSYLFDSMTGLKPYMPSAIIGEK